MARAKGMTQLGRDAGLAREGLYKALSESGNPEFSTMLKVMRALGMALYVAAAKPAKPKGFANETGAGITTGSG